MRRTAPLKPILCNICLGGRWGSSSPRPPPRDCSEFETAALLEPRAGGSPGMDVNLSRDGACRAQGVLCCGIMLRGGPWACFLFEASFILDSGAPAVPQAPWSVLELRPCLSRTLSHRETGSGVIEALREPFQRC